MVCHSESETYRVLRKGGVVSVQQVSESECQTITSYVCRCVLLDMSAIVLGIVMNRKTLWGLSNVAFILIWRQMMDANVCVCM
jgi:hypothetical protein